MVVRSYFNISNSGNAFASTACFVHFSYFANKKLLKQNFLSHPEIVREMHLWFVFVILLFRHETDVSVSNEVFIN